MLVLEDKVLGNKALGEIMESEEDIRLYNVDKENNIVQIEAIGGNLSDLDTEYEIIHNYKEEYFEGKEQFFVIDVNMENNKPLKFTVITKDDKGNDIHVQDISARLSVNETNSIIKFMRNLKGNGKMEM